MTTFRGIGLMSGSSLDGLDICYAEFTGDVDTDVWGYRILRCMTLPYSEDWRQRLKTAHQLSGLDLIKLHIDYGRFLGETADDFIDSEEATPCFVASHGHTVFHQPDQHLTFQLGDGETSAAYLKCPFVCNFRNKDVALGGQGAPLVPGGERYLFSHVDLCVNLGGIANISLRGEKGYDVCGCNVVMNMLAGQHGDFTHDVDGHIGKTGRVLDAVLQDLESLDYYKQTPPKSLGIEWVAENVFPILDTQKYSIPDLLCTYSEHIAREVAKSCCDIQSNVGANPNTFRVHRTSTGSRPDRLKVLVTGGGVFNSCITDRLRDKLKQKDIVMIETDEETVQFKEALLFGFLGLRCLLGLQNVSSAVTGSSMDSVSGSIHLPPKNTISPLSPKSEKLSFGIKRQSSVDNI